MHPLFSQPLKFLSILTAWLIILISFIFLQKSLIGGTWSDLVIWSGPPMILLFFIILSNYFIAKTIRLRDTHVYLPVLKHVVTAILIITLWLVSILLYSKGLAALTNLPTWLELFDKYRIFYASAGLLFYFIGLLLHYLYLESERSHRLEQQALDNKLLAARAELHALKMSIHPHFLFNSFTALHTLIQTVPEKAAAATLQLSNFLRRSLNYAKVDWTTVDDELALIEAYLHIEKTRLAERIQVDYRIDESIRNTYLPPFTLLPLIENAVKHGIEQLVDGGIIKLSIQDEGHSLLIITSNPVNLKAVHKSKNGYGLQALQKRFSVAYTENIFLNKNLNDTQFTLSFRLPLLNQQPA